MLRFECSEFEIRNSNLVINFVDNMLIDLKFG